MNQTLKIFGALIIFGLVALSYSHCGSPLELSSTGQESSPLGGAPNPEGLGEEGGAEGPAPGEASGSVDFSPLAGIYRGGGTHVVFPSGEYWWFAGYGIIRMRYGRMTSVTDSQFSGQITVGSSSPANFSGSYETEQRLEAAQYVANSKNPPSLSSIVGRWWGNIQNGDTPTLTFSEDGQISGYSANFRCNFTGQAIPHPEGLNVFQISLRRSNCVGNGARTDFSGIAIRSGGMLHLLAITDNQNQIFAWEAYR